MSDTTEPPRRRPASGGDRPRDRSAGSGRQGRTPPPPSDDARIAKVMARAGLCSRRDAETWIAAGRVEVNGRTIDSPALNVSPSDRITVDGMSLPEREPTRLFLFNKPRGQVTTSRDPEGRPTIFDNLPEGLPRVVSIGRLDINTEGLLLLTNDGGLARVLELPATGWLRRYRVRANGAIDQARLDALRDGVTIEGVDYAGIEAVLDRVQGANVWLTMGLREGKNREIKRVLESLGLAVTRLIRVSFGPFQLGELAPGAAESVPTRVLREQLGPDLAAKAGVIFPDGGAPPPIRPAGPRRHVSALRNARDEQGEGPRLRIERAATADRRGRPVKVERIVPVASPAEAESGESWNARRFARERNARSAQDDTPRSQTRRREDAMSEGGRPDRSGSGPARPRAAQTRDRQAEAGKSRAGKPGGRPGGFGSERPATGRNRTEGKGRGASARPKGGEMPARRDRPDRPATRSGPKPAGPGPRTGKPGGRPSGGAGGRRPPRGRP